MHIWVMSKAYRDLEGRDLPHAYSYAHNHAAMSYRPNGWGLVCVTCDAHQLEFMRSGTDPNLQVVGRELDPPTPLLLDTYADWLGPGAGQFQFLFQVLNKLGETEPRFLIDVTDLERGRGA